MAQRNFSFYEFRWHVIAVRRSARRIEQRAQLAEWRPLPGGVSATDVSNSGLARQVANGVAAPVDGTPLAAALHPARATIEVGDLVELRPDPVSCRVDEAPFAARSHRTKVVMESIQDRRLEDRLEQQ